MKGSWLSDVGCQRRGRSACRGPRSPFGKFSNGVDSFFVTQEAALRLARRLLSLLRLKLKSLSNVRVALKKKE